MEEHLLRSAEERVAARLVGRRRLLFITGAGLSAESGLPTYRGIGGLYASEHTEHGVPIEVALSGPTFRRNAELTWHHIARLERAVRCARSSEAHALIARLEARHEVVLLTQNVDGFHRTVGSTRVIDIHGDCHDLFCTRCDFRERRADYWHDAATRLSRVRRGGAARCRVVRRGAAGAEARAARGGA